MRDLRDLERTPSRPENVYAVELGLLRPWYAELSEGRRRILAYPLGDGSVLPLLPQQAAALALPGALLLRLALVVKLFAARQSQLDLGAAPLVEIELERHQRHALALHRADELVDLAPGGAKACAGAWGRG